MQGNTFLSNIQNNFKNSLHVILPFLARWRQISLAHTDNRWLCIDNHTTNSLHLTGLLIATPQADLSYLSHRHQIFTMIINRLLSTKHYDILKLLVQQILDQLNSVCLSQNWVNLTQSFIFDGTANVLVRFFCLSDQTIFGRSFR